MVSIFFWTTWAWPSTLWSSILSQRLSHETEYGYYLTRTRWYLRYFFLRWTPLMRSVAIAEGWFDGWATRRCLCFDRFLLQCTPIWVLIKSLTLSANIDKWWSWSFLGPYSNVVSFWNLIFLIHVTLRHFELFTIL